MSYYIIHNGEKSGPFDLVSMIKKVRNGSVTADTELADKNGIIRKASEHEELAEMFLTAQSNNTPAFKDIISELELRRSLTIGFKIMMQNQMSIAYSAALVSITLILGYGMAYLGLGLFGFTLTFILGYIFYAAYLVYMLRIVRGQHVNVSYVFSKVFSNTRALIIVGIIATTCFSIGAALITSDSGVALLFPFIVILGLVVWTFLTFSPLLITEGSLSYQRGMGLSANRITRLDLDDIGIIFALTVINFVATILLIAPMIFTLPITSAAICNIYEDLYT